MLKQLSRLVGAAPPQAFVECALAPTTLDAPDLSPGGRPLPALARGPPTLG